MTTAWHWNPGRPDPCHHRAHACGKSLTLAGWAHLAWLLHRENRRLDRMLRALAREAGR